MAALVYKNTTTTLPGWLNTVHKDHSRGIAYETDTHFVHFYGRSSGLWVVSTGLTATEKKSGTLTDWVIRVFGAEDIHRAKNSVGASISGVWRPGLYYHAETLQALGNSESDQRSAEQALRLLVERLDELLLYVEPDGDGLRTYSHKTRELLILACTEAEATWKHYMRLVAAAPKSGSDFTTRDYVKLLGPLFLSEFEITLKPYASVAPMRPFLDWNVTAPTQTLPWYDAYNKTKHDRTTQFVQATLQNCLYAIAANLVLFCVRFSPFPLLEGQGSLGPLINQLFTIELRSCDPDTFYIPRVVLPSNIRHDLVCGQTRDYVQPWVVSALSL